MCINCLCRHFSTTGLTTNLQLWRGDEPCGAGGGDLPGLPPVVVVLGDDLEDVARGEGDAGLRARDQLVVARLVVELRAHEDVAGRRRGPEG